MIREIPKSLKEAARKKGYSLTPAVIDGIPMYLIHKNRKLLGFYAPVSDREGIFGFIDDSYDYLVSTGLLRKLFEKCGFKNDNCFTRNIYPHVKRRAVIDTITLRIKELIKKKAFEKFIKGINVIENTGKEIILKHKKPLCDKKNICYVRMEVKLADNVYGVYKIIFPIAFSLVLDYIRDKFGIKRVGKIIGMKSEGTVLLLSMLKDKDDNIYIGVYNAVNGIMKVSLSKRGKRS